MICAPFLKGNNNGTILSKRNSLMLTKPHGQKEMASTSDSFCLDNKNRTFV